MEAVFIERGLYSKGERLGQIIIEPFQKFAAIKTSSGIVMLFCAVIALIWANSPASNTYGKVFHLVINIGVNGFSISKPLHFWINEGLMSFFFFAVGLEIKRELLVGELSSFKKASLPAVAAIGGMVVPAGIYLLINL